MYCLLISLLPTLDEPRTLLGFLTVSLDPFLNRDFIACVLASLALLYGFIQVRDIAYKDCYICTMSFAVAFIYCALIMVGVILSTDVGNEINFVFPRIRNILLIFALVSSMPMMFPPTTDKFSMLIVLWFIFFIIAVALYQKKLSLTIIVAVALYQKIVLLIILARDRIRPYSEKENDETRTKSISVASGVPGLLSGLPPRVVLPLSGLRWAAIGPIGPLLSCCPGPSVGPVVVAASGHNQANRRGVFWPLSCRSQPAGGVPGGRRCGYLSGTLPDLGRPTRGTRPGSPLAGLTSPFLGKVVGGWGRRRAMVAGGDEAWWSRWQEIDVRITREASWGCAKGNLLVVATTVRRSIVVAAGGGRSLVGEVLVVDGVWWVLWCLGGEGEERGK
ncbi:hypothetical protein Droror1_Dr00008652 [Drosera rotundifolia]